MGFESNTEYEKSAIDFFLSPRGKYGDAHVKRNGDAVRYDYETHIFVSVTRNGIVKSCWDLTQNKSPDHADKYWEDQKNE
ncbi:MAG: hypothetical protein Q4F31_05385 [Eubacteriales bacterium]|nr:hypothetical protein [Eubacteriales bacterium]